MLIFNNFDSYCYLWGALIFLTISNINNYKDNTIPLLNTYKLFINTCLQFTLVRFYPWN